ncbi:unnamed protein product [Angiostrongylus costaricensis]|uniref:Secreted protein n=1 Tax=Angiostrongylus costaricensis TaxID=334426 RepID=A0A0R3PWT8_ANGCS|nr:unnamed protein product [Angiostrongylus costaricensis]
MGCGSFFGLSLYWWQSTLSFSFMPFQFIFSVAKEFFQCVAINKFARVFNITDPSDWIARNCQLATRYFRQASCPQIQSLIESCFVFA